MRDSGADTYMCAKIILNMRRTTGNDSLKEIKKD